MSDDRYEKGMAMRKSVLGAEHVARAEANKTDLDADYQRYITEGAWGSIWTRPGLDKKTRHLLTIAMLGAVESLLSAVVADGMAGTRHNSNQELVGQGIANIAAPLFGKQAQMSCPTPSSS